MSDPIQDVDCTTIKAAWGWTGLDPARVLARNAFGNLIVEDHDEVLWRIMPEELSCAPLGLPEIPWGSEAFRADWEMAALVTKASAALGPLGPRQSYQIVLPGLLGGSYDVDNMAICSLASLITLYGGMARQLANVPDGVAVSLAITP